MNVAYDSNGKIMSKGEDVSKAGGQVLTGVDPTLDLWLYDVIDGKLTVVPERAWQSIRNLRNSLLSVSDWTQLADTPTVSKDWSAYRQALRDIPQTYATPEEVIWPDPPAVDLHKVFTSQSIVVKPVIR
jgi:hypothetical protein